MSLRTVLICSGLLSILILPVNSTAWPQPHFSAISEDDILEEVLSKPSADYESLSAGDLEKSLLELKKIRLAILQRAIDAVVREYEAGLRDATLATVMNAHEELAQAELDYAESDAERIRALQRILAAARQLQAEVKLKNSVGAAGGSTSQLIVAAGFRLKYEERLAKVLHSSKLSAK